MALEHSPRSPYVNNPYNIPAKEVSIMLPYYRLGTEAEQLCFAGGCLGRSRLRCDLNQRPDIRGLKNAELCIGPCDSCQASCYHLLQCRHLKKQAHWMWRLFNLYKLIVRLISVSLCITTVHHSRLLTRGPPAALNSLACSEQFITWVPEMDSCTLCRTLVLHLQMTSNDRCWSSAEFGGHLLHKEIGRYVREREINTDFICIWQAI